MTHQNGEPGIVFLERYDKLNITNMYHRIIGTNPCSEYGAAANFVCNLASINLVNMVENKTFNYEKFNKVIKKGITFLDEIIDINPYYQETTKQLQKDFRNIGLGLMGLADMFILMNVKYGSNKSKILLEKIMKFFQNKSFYYSSVLAKEKGVVSK
jgi:ribonucleoside-diphosphate reductase alpha chain